MSKYPNWITSMAVSLSFATAGFAEELHLYNWGEYINPEILKQFTDETGIDVTLDTYSSNEEMLAKIQAGATDFDIVFPSVHMVDIMIDLDLLAKTEINTHKGFANIDPKMLNAKNDPNGEYCLPYAWGTVGVFYDEAKTGPITSWAEFFEIPKNNPEHKIVLLDDMREVIGVGLMVNGHSVNSTDPAEIEAARDYIIAQKPNVTAFTYETTGMLLSGDVAAGHYFVGLAAETLPDPNSTIKYVIPSEGATRYQEDICVLKTAPNFDNAVAFMDFFTRPEISALNTNQQFNGSANIPAWDLVDDIIKNDPNINVDAETAERLQMFEDVGPAVKLYDRAWNSIQTAQ